MEIIRTGNPDDLSSISYETVHCDPSEIAVPDWEAKVQTLSSFIKHYPRELVIQVLEAQMGDILPVRECFRDELREMAAQPVTPSRSPRQRSTASKRKAPARKTKVAKKKSAGRQTRTTKKGTAPRAKKKSPFGGFRRRR